MNGAEHGPEAVRPPAPLLQVEQVSKTFKSGQGRLNALRPVSFEMSHSDFLCIVGPSGSGKSTLLRIIGGLVPPSSGQVRMASALLTGPSPEIGFVFQQTNLMPWRTVLENLLLPLEIRHGAVTRADRQLAQELLTLVGLEEFGGAYPRQLSGGMGQRVVLARSLIQKPRLLLMDEPFGALDALTRERLNLELLRLCAIHGQTALMVTHSITEAVFLADRVLILSERPGQIKAQVAVDLPRPRRLEMMGDEPFGRLTTEVRRAIGELDSGLAG